MIELWDTFNNSLISRSRTVEAAVMKQERHSAKVKKNNGKNSFVTYSFRHNGESVCQDLIAEIKMNLHFKSTQYQTSEPLPWLTMSISN
jgi:hypothetical protein